MKLYQQVSKGSSTVAHLDQIRISPEQRRIALDSMRQAEMIVDMLMRAHAALRQVLGLIRRLAGAFAHRSKRPALKHELH